MNKYIKLEDAIETYCKSIEQNKSFARMLQKLPSVEIEVSEDAISKEYILSLLSGCYMGDDDYIAGLNDAQNEIRERVQNAPSVIPSRPKGVWIEQEDDYHHYWECSECGMGVGLDDIRNYCPHCGADMRGDYTDYTDTCEGWKERGKK